METETTEKKKGLFENIKETFNSYNRKQKNAYLGSIAGLIGALSCLLPIPIIAIFSFLAIIFGMPIYSLTLSLIGGIILVLGTVFINTSLLFINIINSEDLLMDNTVIMQKLGITEEYYQEHKEK